MICRKAFFLAGLTLCVGLCSFSQTVTSARNGSWSDPSTWDANIVPDSANATVIRILHDVYLDAVEMHSYSLEIRGRLHIRSDALLQVNSADGINGFMEVNGGRLDVDGGLAGRDGVNFLTSSSNTFFSATGRFHFRGGPKSFIPMASWDAGSSLIIEGFRSSGYVALAYSAGWRQEFGNVVYDCPLQSAFVDLNGHLRSIRGDFLVRNTNSNALRLSTTQRPLISIGGDLIVEGRSEIWFNTTGDSTRVLIGGDFIYRSASTGPSYLATRGRTFLRVGGTMEVDASGPLRFCSGSTDSTGVRRTTVDLRGDLRLLSGALISPSPGRASMIFFGSGLQMVTAQHASFNGNFNFVFERGSVVDLGLSRLAGSGAVHFKGHLRLGSPAAEGALHPVNGNVATVGSRYFYPGSAIEYNGVTPQIIGNDHPSDSAIHLIAANSAGVTLVKDISVKNFAATGPFNYGGRETKIFGDVSVSPLTTVVGSGTVRLAGGKNQIVSFAGNTITALDIAKDAATMVTLTSPLSIRRRLSISSENTRLESAGFLTLLSAGDGYDSTATVSALPFGSVVSGNVTVQRHMHGEGRLYRYISSPVANETVAGLKDDFPVTGTFQDPSVGRGLNSTGPSLYYFDESLSNSASGWMPYPSLGLASANSLLPGRGYAAYIRQQKKATIIDFNGVLNQGEIILPVQFTTDSPEPVRGWNLVGNPYAAVIDWSAEAGWERSEDISASFAIRDNASGRFHYSDGEIGDLESPVIAPAQSFWIRTSAPTPYVIINELAKSDNSAEFYRARRKKSLDYVKVSVRGNGHQDNVYLRKRLGASPALDRNDAVKMRNDFLSLSLLSADSVSLAISARNAFSCRERFPLKLEVRSGVNGYFTFHAEPFGEFRTAAIMVHDALTDSITFTDGYRFVVDAVPASRNPRRFTLIIEEKQSQEPLISMPRLKCNGTSTRIQLSHGNVGSYYVSTESGGAYEFVSEDSIRSVTIPLSKSLEDEFQVYSRSFCGDRLVGALKLMKDAPPPAPVVVSAIRCEDGPVMVQLRAGPDTVEYHVFPSLADSVAAYRTGSDRFAWQCSAEGRFYIAAVNHSGCESDRVEVLVEKRVASGLAIEYRDGSLHSTHQGRWYYDGALVSDDTLFQVEPFSEGTYAVRSVVNECEAEASYVIAFDDDLEISPVPFDDRLRIRSRRSSLSIGVVRLHTAEGKLLSEAGTTRGMVVLETTGLPRGVYVVEVRFTDGRVRRRRVVK